MTIPFDPLIEDNPPPSFPQSEYIVELMGPQLGLFCQVTFSADITLFNPATRMFKQVPPIEFLDWKDIHPRTYTYGFGLDPLTHDYKIVVFHQPRWEPTTFACIYDSTSDSWKSIEASQTDWMNRAIISNPRTFVNGVYYWWIVAWSRNWDDFIRLSFVLAFDMGTERFQGIQLPFQNTATGYSVSLKNLVQIGGSLVVLAFENGRVDVWVMGKEGFWTRSSRIGPFERTPKSLSMWKNELVLSSYYSSDHLILIDVSTQKQKKIAIPKIANPQLSDFYSALFYKESLVSIKGEQNYSR